jgi:hypothetical protein
MKALAISVVLIAAVSSCDRPASDNERGAVRNAAASSSRVVDSALPPAELLRRFRVGFDSVAGLEGAVTRELLVKRFFTALDARDANALRSLAVTRAEFAWLVFPGSRISLPPYNQPPDIAWLMMQASSNTGLARVLQRDGGGKVRYLEHACANIDVDGAVRVHSNCSVRVFSSGEYLTRRLFGSIVERDRRFKFLSFANEY